MAGVVLRDAPRRGAVALAVRRGLARRAEPGSCGPLVLEARTEVGEVVCEVWGSPSTPSEEAEQALEAAVGWAGLRDAPGRLDAVVAGHQPLAEVARRVGEVRLGRLPRLGESLGRAVLAQLVQGVEAWRSVAQVAAGVGQRAPGGLWTWPTAAQLGAAPAWALRRSGVSLRGARALHAGAVADVRLTEAVGDWPLLDRRLRTLPGVGAWTSAETRLALGDADAVSVGDYHLPSVVGCVMVGEPVDDDGMVELLAPFAGQRGRVIRLCEIATRRGLGRRAPRRGPHSAVSAHRYW